MKIKIMKKLAVATIIGSMSFGAYAVGNGFYMGLMMGPSTNNGNDTQAQVLNPTATSLQVTNATPKSTQFGSRFFMGNKFSPYFGFEGGVTLFSGIKYDTKGVQLCSGDTARVRALDFLGKATGQFGYFDFFAKGGVSYSYLTTSGSFNPAFDPSKGLVCGQSTYTSKFSPVVGIGASYDINQSWVADASITRYQVGGVISNVTLYALGISYHFVDRYCGQFLCDD